MHLGDVYYSGTEKEVEERFLNSGRPTRATINRALNGNHEMYSGGFGYFKLILPAFEQEAPTSRCRTSTGCSSGLDTAYVDHDMDNTQVAWLNLIVESGRASASSCCSRTSSRSRGSTTRARSCRTRCSTCSTRSDHAPGTGATSTSASIYDGIPQWGLLGRCLGNGGIPEARKTR